MKEKPSIATGKTGTQCGLSFSNSKSLRSTTSSSSTATVTRSFCSVTRLRKTPKNVITIVGEVQLNTVVKDEHDEITPVVENLKQEQTLNQEELWLVPSQQIDLRRRGEPDLPEEEVRKQERVQMLTQQVFEFHRKSQIVEELFKMHLSDNEMNSDEKEFHNVSVEDSDILKIEDRVQCSVCHDHANPGFLFCECG